LALFIVLYLRAMDYFVGFILGYCLKEMLALLKRLSDWDYDNRRTYDFDIGPITEDDLP